jgi:hypothetical protein
MSGDAEVDARDMAWLTLVGVRDGSFNGTTSTRDHKS